jgi:hypothetical protein
VDTDESRWEARLKAVAKPACATDEMTRKAVSKTMERVAKSRETLRRTKPAKKRK